MLRYLRDPHTVCIHPTDPSLPCDGCAGSGRDDCFKIYPKTLDGKLDLNYQLVLYAQHVADRLRNPSNDDDDTQELQDQLDNLVFDLECFGDEVEEALQWEQDNRKVMSEVEKRKGKISSRLQHWNKCYEVNGLLDDSMRDYICSLEAAEKITETAAAETKATELQASLERVENKAEQQAQELRRFQEKLERLRVKSAKLKASKVELKQALQHHQAELEDAHAGAQVQRCSHWIETQRLKKLITTAKANAAKKRHQEDSRLRKAIHCLQSCQRELDVAQADAQTQRRRHRVKSQVLKKRMKTAMAKATKERRKKDGQLQKAIQALQDCQSALDAATADAQKFREEAERAKNDLAELVQSSDFDSGFDSDSWIDNDTDMDYEASELEFQRHPDVDYEPSDLEF